jgi:DNA-binding transcriptional LysR family regulator
MTMRRSLPPLAALRAFEAAGRRLSFRGAADELSVTPTAISHQVRLLEQTLGLRLFHRETRRVRLTAEGAVLLPVLRDGFDAFAEVIDQLRGGHAAGILTLSAPTAFVAKWLVPRLADFVPRIPLATYACTRPTAWWTSLAMAWTSLSGTGRVPIPTSTLAGSWPSASLLPVVPTSPFDPWVT